jgi:hypothetical protein
MNEITEIALPETTDIVALFRAPAEVDRLIEKIETEVRSHVPDTRTAKGRKAIASLAAKVSSSKTFLDNAGKKLNEDARAQINIVDAERRKIRNRLDALRDEARKPLTEWEEADRKRIADLNSRLDQLSVDVVAPDAHSTVIEVAIKAIEATPIDESWQEFFEQAAMRKDNALRMLRERWMATRRREDDEAELARLRAEKEERERKDAEERAAREAEEQRRQAEIRAQEEAARLEREKAEAAERARKDAEEKAAREKAEAERRHQEALERAEREKAEAIEAERRRAESERLEREKAEADRKAREEADRLAREQDEKHRRDVYETIQRAILEIPHRDIARALMAGKIPHVRVEL